MSKGANDLNALVELLVSCQTLGDYANVAKEKKYGQFVRACIQNGLPNLSALREILPTLTPEAQNFLNCYILGAQARADKVSNDFLLNAQNLLQNPPLACCVEPYSDVFRKFIEYHRKNSAETFGELLPFIQTVVRNLQQGKAQVLTSAHCELLHTIWTQLEWSRFDHETALVELQPGINIEEFLRYYYYAGSIHLLHKRYSEAIAALNVVLNVPSDPNSASLIVVDAYKKYRIACLIHNGSVKSLPRGHHGAYNGAPTPEYSDLETAFQSAVKGSNDSLELCMAKHLDAFTADKNLGLVRRTLGAVARHRMHQLRKVYLAAPLSKITKIVMQPSQKDEDTKRLLKQMVQANELMITTEDRKEGTIVRFQDAVDLRGKAESIRCKVNTLSKLMLEMARRNELKAQEV